MGSDFDIEASGLLDGLDGKARADRAELIPWLLDQGVTIEQIRDSDTPVLLASRRILGDDGDYVSAREISDKRRDQPGVAAAYPAGTRPAAGG